MEPRSVAEISGSNGVLNWIGGAVVAAVVLVGLLLTVHTAINAEDVWESIDQQNAAKIEQENRDFCGKFAVEPGTEAYESCSRELENIRQVHAERIRRYRF